MSDRTDEETLELIREWLQQYGLTIIIGLVLGLGAIGGYRYWQGKQAEQRYNESAQLNTILQALEQNKPQDAASAYDSLLKEGGEIAELAALNMAGAYRKENKNDDAMAALKLAAASKTNYWRKAPAGNWLSCLPPKATTTKPCNKANNCVTAPMPPK